jgi:ribosomal 50S subunit-recycling heat shock protein
MRLDLFLKESRLIKRRPKAKEYCDKGLVEINGISAKAGREVAGGDIMLIKYPRRLLTIEVLSLPHRGSSPVRAAQCYRVIEDNPIAPQDSWWDEDDQSP